MRDIHDILEKYKVGKRPPNYAGEWPDSDDYAVIAVTRDSDLLAQSNWATARSRIMKADPDWGGDTTCGSGWYVHQASHWAVGWVDQLIVRKDAPEPVLREAAEIVRDLEAYPVLDEDDWSEKVAEAAQEYWDRLSGKEKLEQGGDPDDLDRVPDEVLDMVREW